jgi:hypothetical protein
MSWPDSIFSYFCGLFLGNMSTKVFSTMRIYWPVIAVRARIAAMPVSTLPRYIAKA